VTAALHPVLGTPLPPVTEAVQPGLRDWAWAANARRRMGLVRLVLATKGRTCHLCGQAGATTADHVVPWSHGGRNELDNLEPAHMGCNRARSDRPLVEWFTRRPVVRAALAPSRAW